MVYSSSSYFALYSKAANSEAFLKKELVWTIAKQKHQISKLVIIV